ncbi:MAG TPA: protein YgfX [Burkholderiales bacterium]
MSTASPAELALELGASRGLAAVFIAVYGGAFLICTVLPLALGWRLSLALLVAAAFWRALYRHAWRRGPRAVTAFKIGADDACAIRRGAGDWEPARLVEQWVHPWLTVLVVRPARSRVAAGVLVPADAVSPEAFRRLRVRLRLQTAA